MVQPGAAHLQRHAVRGLGQEVLPLPGSQLAGLDRIADLGGEKRQETADVRPGEREVGSVRRIPPLWSLLLRRRECRTWEQDPHQVESLAHVESDDAVQGDTAVVAAQDTPGCCCCSFPPECLLMLSSRGTVEKPPDHKAKFVPESLELGRSVPNGGISLYGAYRSWSYSWLARIEHSSDEGEKERYRGTEVERVCV